MSNLLEKTISGVQIQDIGKTGGLTTSHTARLVLTWERLQHQPWRTGDGMMAVSAIMVVTRMIRTQVQLTEEQDLKLENLAASLRVSKAELVRQAVDLLLEQRAKGQTMEERWARALGAVGAFRGDGANVSEEHDRYLAEAYAVDGRTPATEEP